MEAYKQTVDTVTKEVSVNTETGLTQQEAQQRLKENGRNQFEEAKNCLLYTSDAADERVRV